LWNDNEQFLDAHVACVVADIRAGGETVQAVGNLAASLECSEAA
jgi:hypothetical protein